MALSKDFVGCRHQAATVRKTDASLVTLDSRRRPSNFETCDIWHTKPILLSWFETSRPCMSFCWQSGPRDSLDGAVPAGVRAQFKSSNSHHLKRVSETDDQKTPRLLSVSFFSPASAYAITAQFSKVTPNSFYFLHALLRRSRESLPTP